MPHLTGAGIGGEYAAINSAIDELIPKKYRGRIDIAINGSFWIGAAGGALLTIPLLDPTLVPAECGWRLAFGLGAILAVGILIVRRNVPESPRWLFIHGREDEGDEIVADIEKHGRRGRGPGPARARGRARITIRQRKTISLVLIAKTVFTLYPKRTVLCLASSSARRSSTTRSSSPTATPCRPSSASSRPATTSRPSRSATSSARCC